MERLGNTAPVSPPSHYSIVMEDHLPRYPLTHTVRSPVTNPFPDRPARPDSPYPREISFPPMQRMDLTNFRHLDMTNYPPSHLKWKLRIDREAFEFQWRGAGVTPDLSPATSTPKTPSLQHRIPKCWQPQTCSKSMTRIFGSNTPCSVFLRMTRATADGCRRLDFSST